MDLTRFSIKHLLSKPKKPIKVFCVGTLKTGTTSLSSALKHLGYNHSHKGRGFLLKCVERGQLTPIYNWVKRYDSFDDWPWPLIYPEMDERYPGSKFILTTRVNGEKWLTSIKKHADFTGPTNGRKLFFGHEMPHGNEKQYLSRYQAHNQKIRDYFKNRSGRLLEVCWERGDGWEKLSNFLDEPCCPNINFPQINTSNNRINK